MIEASWASHPLACTVDVQWLMQVGCQSSHSIWLMAVAEQYGFEDVIQQAVSFLKAHAVDCALSA